MATAHISNSTKHIQFKIYLYVWYKVHGDNEEARKQDTENLSSYILNIPVTTGFITELPQTLVRWCRPYFRILFCHRTSSKHSFEPQHFVQISHPSIILKLQD